MHACNTYLSRYRLIEADRSSTRAGLPMQNFSDFELSSTEPKSLRFDRVDLASAFEKEKNNFISLFDTTNCKRCQTAAVS
jgi:hypothetical protein